MRAGVILLVGILAFVGYLLWSEFGKKDREEREDDGEDEVVVLGEGAEEGVLRRDVDVKVMDYGVERVDGDAEDREGEVIEVRWSA